MIERKASDGSEATARNGHHRRGSGRGNEGDKTTSDGMEITSTGLLAVASAFESGELQHIASDLLREYAETWGSDGETALRALFDAIGRVLDSQHGAHGRYSVPCSRRLCQR